jgi:hypothetical protein
MPYIVNRVAIERVESLEDIKKVLKTFLSYLIIIRDYID